MALPAELTDLMHDEVTLEHATGRDGYNKPTYADPVTAVCYIARANREVIDIGGREMTSTVQVFLADPTIEVGSEDRLTLPDGSQPVIVEILAAPDENGDPYYLEIRA